jgi:hypothetical protein
MSGFGPTLLNSQAAPVTRARPVMFRAIFLVTFTHPPGFDAITFTGMFGNGDCFLFAAAISVSAIGEMIAGTSDRQYPRERIVAIGANLSVVLGAAVWYGSIAHSNFARIAQAASREAARDAEALAWLVARSSVVVLLISFVVGVYGVQLAEEAQWSNSSSSKSLPSP